MKIITSSVSVKTNPIFKLGPQPSADPAHTNHAPRATSHGAKRMILQNKPNFLKTKMNLNIFSERRYENKSPIPSLRKQTQSNPIFSWCRVWSFGFGAWNLFGVLDLVLGILLLGDCTPESRATIMQNKPNFGRMKNEPNPLFRKDLRRKIPLPPTRKTNPIQTQSNRSEAQIPTGELLGPLKPGTRIAP